ncbi:hypothetical protein ES288_A03G166700v1 [Gossypium darwinii]|uniref:Uncharacterized protein n=1 Tax=Gossypium darwinii TaxID=34276 RepID=A0A5D2H5C5_GOSDA|nr:hypothetical protein ES288_A03G166700v1 [Gossypium darwinii]
MSYLFISIRHFWEKKPLPFPFPFPLSLPSRSTACCQAAMVLNTNRRCSSLIFPIFAFCCRNLHYTTFIFLSQRYITDYARGLKICGVVY